MTQGAFSEPRFNNYRLRPAQLDFANATSPKSKPVEGKPHLVLGFLLFRRLVKKKGGRLKGLTNRRFALKYVKFYDIFSGEFWVKAPKTRVQP